MQRLAEEQKKQKMNSDGDGVCPSQPTAGDVWLNVLDRVVRTFTFGRGRVLSRPSARAPAKWCKR